MMDSNYSFFCSCLLWRTLVRSRDRCSCRHSQYFSCDNRSAICKRNFEIHIISFFERDLKIISITYIQYHASKWNIRIKITFNLVTHVLKICQQLHCRLSRNICVPIASRRIRIIFEKSQRNIYHIVHVEAAGEFPWCLDILFHTLSISDVSRSVAISVSSDQVGLKSSYIEPNDRGPKMYSHRNMYFSTDI